MPAPQSARQDCNILRPWHERTGNAKPLDYKLVRLQYPVGHPAMLQLLCCAPLACVLPHELSSPLSVRQQATQLSLQGSQ